MLIANPIYDVVFKYLMEDERVARLIISTIIEEEIEELHFTPRERTAHVSSLGVTVYRLDFSAVIRTADGKRRNVLIELQKADRGDDVRRFRRYLAENYYDESEMDLDIPHVSEGPAPVLPIISIYILGQPLNELRGYSAVKIKRHYYDAVTGEQIIGREHFVECLTHDSYVIQLSELKGRRRSRLEQLLALFEQMHVQANRHLKEFSDELPEEFEPLLRRLTKAALDRKMRDEMEIEDDVLFEWKKKERQWERKVNEAQALADKAQVQAAEAQVQAAEAQAQTVEEKSRLERVRKNAIQALMAAGMTREEAEKTLDGEV